MADRSAGRTRAGYRLRKPIIVTRVSRILDRGRTALSRRASLDTFWHRASPARKNCQSDRSRDRALLARTRFLCLCAAASVGCLSTDPAASSRVSTRTDRCIGDEERYSCFGTGIRSPDSTRPHAARATTPGSSHENTRTGAPCRIEHRPIGSVVPQGGWSHTQATLRPPTIPPRRSRASACRGSG